MKKLLTKLIRHLWDEANEISTYDPVSLGAYLDRQDTLFVVCHDATATPSTFMGMASCRFEIKPYGQGTLAVCR